MVLSRQEKNREKKKKRQGRHRAVLGVRRGAGIKDEGRCQGRPRKGPY